MRILYFITSRRGTPGGHAFSLEHTISALSNFFSVGVLVLGKAVPNIEKLDSYIGSVPLSVKSYKHLKRYIDHFSPDVIHCFDVTSYVYVSLGFSLKYRRIIYTHCGGPNPNSGVFMPYATRIILYSKENLKYFIQNKLFVNIEFKLLPNRIDLSLLNNQNFYTYPDKCFNICQIIRIHSSKEKVIFNSLNLMNELKKRGTVFHFTLVGTVTTGDLYQKILMFLSDNALQEYVSVITDERTCLGSSFLKNADCVIATGRSLMEACSLGKIVLCPVSNISIPILIREDNFQTLFDTNFSGRAVVFSDEDSEFDYILKIVNNIAFRESIFKCNKHIAENYFLITKEVILKYKELYAGLKPVSLFHLYLRNLHIYLYYFLWLIKK